MKFYQVISKTYFAILLVLSLTLISCNNDKPTSLADIEDDFGIIFSSSDRFFVQSNNIRKGKKRSFQTIKATNDKTLLKIEIISPIELEDVYKNIEEKFNIINSLYTNLPSPYPGMVTKKIKYSESLRPEYKLVDTPSQTIPLYFLSSNERFIYGAMGEELISYKGFLTFIYNPVKKSLARLDYFVPKEQYIKEKALIFVNSISLKEPITRIILARKTIPEKPTTDIETKTAIVQSPIKKPQNNLNVIIIGFEPLGSNHVGSYGYSKNTTPNLDAFAKEAFLFKNVVSPSSWTLPVFMSWFTSLYPSQHKITNKYSIITDSEQKLANLSELSPNVVTLAEVLKAHGYQTAGFTGSAGVSSDFGYAKGFDTYYDKKIFAGFDDTMPMALEWINQHKNDDFFLFVQGYDVHGRFPLDEHASENFLYKEYKGELKGTEDEYWSLRNKNIDEGKLNLTKEDIKFLQSVYDAKISAADMRFGHFVKELQQMGIFDNTVIVISSGSGNEYYEHKRIDHGFSLYEELIQVPLIIKLPQKKAGSTKNLARTIDIMPTILDILKVQTQQTKNQIQGVSLLPLIEGEEIKLDGFSETDYLLQTFKRAITAHDGWKFIISLDTDERELYDLNRDPNEQKNVIEQNGKTAYELEQKLFSHLSAISRK